MAEYIERSYIRKMAMFEMAYTMETETDAAVVLRMIDDAPAADVAPVVHGRWIEDHDYLKCPECSVMVKRDFTFFDIGDWNFCPNCGAKMDKKEATHD